MEIHDELDEKTVEFIFDYTKEAPERQSRDLDALDNKMVQVFSAASVVIGLAGISSTTLGSTGDIDVLLTIAVITYVVAAVAALIHLSPKKQRRSLHVEELWPRCWNMKVKDIQHALIEDIRKAYSYNSQVLKRKRGTLVVAVGATGIEVVSVGITLISSRFS